MESTRLKDWDYSSDGWYFVTICTKNMVGYFGDIRNFIMGLSDIGCIATKFWNEKNHNSTNVEMLQCNVSTGGKSNVLCNSKNNENRKYIYDNPQKCELDHNNPENLWM